MKNEPFINYTLNSETPRDTRVIHYTAKMKMDVNTDDITTFYRMLPYSRMDYALTKYMTRIPKNTDRMRYNTTYRDGKPQVSGKVYKSKLYDNTRPQSLYNLNYATLR